jgi:hypothetical protein
MVYKIRPVAGILSIGPFQAVTIFGIKTFSSDPFCHP